METVNFLASLWGFSLIIVSLAFLINSKNVEHVIRLAEDEKMLLLVGIINIVLGITLVLTYNVWDSSWKVLITILGWLVIVRGSLILFFPNIVKKGVAKIKTYRDWFSVILVACILLGCLLIYFGQPF